MPTKFELPLVSIIITTKNEEALIENLLWSIKKQEYKKIQIILVDNNSKDQTKQKASMFDIEIYNYGPERSAQRNYGSRKSKGKFILFLDADMELQKNVVKECVENILKDESIAVVEIPEKSIATSFWGRVKSFERSFYNEKGDPITDAGRFFRKAVFKKVGGYDESITGPEDWDLPETIREKGYKIARINSFIYHHERVLSPLSLARKKFYYGLKAYRYLNKHKISVMGPKTIYFLRPVFYSNWKKMLSNPFLTLAMFIMLSAELIGGGAGYLIGKIRKL